jgi:hypothetical protein
MKIYEGERAMDGVKVTVNGTPLASRNDIRSFTHTGFEWGFVGPGPQQLALALLADHLGDDERALALCRSFMERLTSQLDNDWQLTAADISVELEKDLPQGEFGFQTYH